MLTLSPDRICPCFVNVEYNIVAHLLDFIRTYNLSMTRNISLFCPFNLKEDLLKEQTIAQEVVYYCDSRFRSILVAYNQAAATKRQWMVKEIQNELESSHLLHLDPLLISFQGFDLKYIGMAAATGVPLEIPILTRSIASLCQTHVQEHTPVGLDLNILMVLDAGSAPNDPSAIVSEYKYNWWHGMRPPLPGNILWSGTVIECIIVFIGHLFSRFRQ